MVHSVIDKPIDTNRNRNTFGWKVVVWNCNCHSFQDVAMALMIAVKCSLEKGLQYADTVHNSGKAIVFSGHKERAELVAEILKEARLRVTMEQ